MALIYAFIKNILEQWTAMTESKKLTLLIQTDPAPPDLLFEP